MAAVAGRWAAPWAAVWAAEAREMAASAAEGRGAVLWAVVATEGVAGAWAVAAAKGAAEEEY